MKFSEIKVGDRLVFVNDNREAAKYNGEWVTVVGKDPDDRVLPWPVKVKFDKAELNAADGTADVEPSELVRTYVK